MKTSSLVSGITPRKLIGTLVLAFVVAVGAFGSAKAAQALFIGVGPTTIFDGVITGVNDNTSLDVATNGTNTVTVNVGAHTVITGNQSLSDLTPGEAVKIVARNQNGTLVARVINASANTGYGTAGDAVVVQHGRVVSTSGTGNSGTIVVNVNGVNVTFHINSSTRFLRSSFTDLSTGDKVMVVGHDTGSSSTGFVAQFVFGQ